MYFAVNPCSPGLPDQMLRMLAQLRDQHPAAPKHCYLLIDASFDQALPVTFPWRRTVEGSLYDGMNLEGLKAVAPHLIRLPDDTKRQHVWLQQLVDACAGKPMLSMLISAIPAEQLKQHFKPYLVARSDDSLEWPVRWADTRTLPGLIGALIEKERQHLLSPLYAWVAADRQGKMIDWKGEGNPHPAPADFDCWPMDDGRFSRLVSEAEADAVIGALHDTQPDLFDMREPDANHACVKRHLVIASLNGIEGAGQRQHLAMLALSLKDDFIEHPAMQSMLKRTREGANYAAEVAALPADFWQQTDRRT